LNINNVVIVIIQDRVQTFYPLNTASCLNQMLSSGVGYHFIHSQVWI